MVADLQARAAKAQEASDRMWSLESRLMRSEEKLAEAEHILATKEDLEAREDAVRRREEGLEAAVTVPDASLKAEFEFFFSSRRRHTRLQGDWSSTCALPISACSRKRPSMSG